MEEEIRQPEKDVGVSLCQMFDVFQVVPMSAPVCSTKAHPSPGMSRRLARSRRGNLFITAGTSVIEEVYDALNLGGIFVEEDPEMTQLVSIHRKFRSFETRPRRFLTM